MSAKSPFFTIAAPLFLVLFIDGMGLGLVIPVLNGLLFDTNSTFMSQYANSAMMQNVIYGSIIGIFMLCWFFGAAILGDLSDKIGRKKSLLICLLGAALSYLISSHRRDSQQPHIAYSRSYYRWFYIRQPTHCSSSDYRFKHIRK